MTCYKIYDTFHLGYSNVRTCLRCEVFIDENHQRTAQFFEVLHQLPYTWTAFFLHRNKVKTMNFWWAAEWIPIFCILIRAFILYLQLMEKWRKSMLSRCNKNRSQWNSFSRSVCLNGRTSVPLSCECCRFSFGSLLL